MKEKCKIFKMGMHMCAYVALGLWLLSPILCALTAEEEMVLKDLPVFREKANKGDPVYQAIMGGIYDDGIGVEKNIDEALKWYRKAVQKGNDTAQLRLGLCYELGNGVKQDYGEAVRLYSMSAKQGNEAAQARLGRCYYEGLGVPKDYTEAYEWFRKAEEGGIDVVFGYIGDMCQDGMGTKKDVVKAAEYYCRGAEKNDTYCMVKLGQCYEEGQGVQQDEAQALSWYRKAAEQGDMSGEFKVGCMYVLGKGGLKVDYGEAIKYLRRAAEKGDLEAKAILAGIYALEEGGGEKDDEQGMKLLREAAERGNQTAQALIQRLENQKSSLFHNDAEEHTAESQKSDKHVRDEKGSSSTSTGSTSTESRELHESDSRSTREMVRADVSLQVDDSGRSRILVVSKDSWLGLSNVPVGQLQIGLHATRGELPTLELFAAKSETEIDESTVLQPVNSSISYSSRGLGETCLFNYDVQTAGSYFVHVIPGSGEKGEYLVLIGEVTKEVIPSKGKTVIDFASAHRNVSDSSLFLSVLILLLIISLIFLTAIVGHLYIRRPQSQDGLPFVKKAPPGEFCEHYILRIEAEGQRCRVNLDFNQLMRVPLSIGRSSSCSVMLEEAQISSSHAEIGVRNGKLYLSDLHSTNGTRINGRRLNPGESIFLQPGDQIQIASAHIKLIKL